VGREGLVFVTDANNNDRVLWAYASAPLHPGRPSLASSGRGTSRAHRLHGVAADDIPDFWASDSDSNRVVLKPCDVVDCGLCCRPWSFAFRPRRARSEDRPDMRNRPDPTRSDVSVGQAALLGVV
jgi:hypothetical protein